MLKKQDIPAQDWEDWQWQFRYRLRTLSQLDEALNLTDDEKESLTKTTRFAVGITPYFASIMDPHDPNCPIRRQAIPLGAEFISHSNDLPDPLAEETRSPVPYIVHRYPDRVLLIVTETCHMYCRHCTRKRRVGFHEEAITSEQLAIALKYIEEHTEVRDVLVSGGDPLSLGDERLERILAEVHRIKHVEVIRIGSRAPITNPFRITQQFVEMLRQFHPIWMNVQFNHPNEITAESTKACERLADAGIPLGNQTVLLRGINDTVEIQKHLVQKLVQIRVRPYYLYQCDLVQGLEHFRTPVSRGIEIMEHLRGHTSGFAIPTFVIDAPGGGGKIPVTPQYVLYQTPEKIVLRNYEGKVFTYPEPIK